MGSETPLPSALQKTLEELIQRVNLSGGSVCSILLSTSEGVPLGRVYGGYQPLNEDVIAALESVWASAPKQLPLLGMGKAQHITAIYDHGILVHVYLPPVVVTILCGPQANLGAIRTTAIPLLKVVLEPLCTTLLDSLKPEYDS